MKWFNSSKKKNDKKHDEKNIKDNAKVSRKNKKLEKAESKKLNKENRKKYKQKSRIFKRINENINNQKTVNTNNEFFESNNFQNFYPEPYEVKDFSLIDNAISIAEERVSEEPNLLTENEIFFEEEKEPIYEESILPVEEFGVPFDISYDKNDPITKNISFDHLYTKEDLDRLELSPDNFVKFFKNGTVFYKMNPMITETDVSIKKIFKSGTKFSQQSIRNDEESILKNYDLGNLFKGDVTSVSDIIKFSSEDDEKREKLKEKILKLNEEIESRISFHNNFDISDEDTAAAIMSRKKIEQKQEELNSKIYELKDNYVNNNIFYKVQNVFFNTWDEDNIYFGYKLEDVTFDVYSGDRIVVISDDSITNQLLIDVLRGDEVKTSGYVYKNLFRKNQWIDTDDLKFNYSTLNDIDLNDELMYGLTSPDYLSFGLKKKDNVLVSMKKIFSSLGKSPNEKFVMRLIELMSFDSETNKNIFELDDLNLEKFITICDIAIDKKMILIKNICQGMSFNQKNDLLIFLNEYFTKNNVTVIYASDDLYDVNLCASKVMVIKKSQVIDFKPIEKILDTFKTVNDYVFYNLKYGKLKDIEND